MFLRNKKILMQLKNKKKHLFLIYLIKTHKNQPYKIYNQKINIRNWKSSKFIK